MVEPADRRFDGAVGAAYPSAVALSPTAWRDRRRSSGKPSYAAVFDIPSQAWELRRVVR